MKKLFVSAIARSIQAPLRPGNKVWAYLTTTVIVALTAGLQLLLWPLIEPAPYILFYPMVLFAALYGDGILAIALAVIIVRWMFVLPYFEMSATFPSDFVRDIIFIISGLMVRYVTVALVTALRTSQEAQLEIQLSETRLGNVLTNAIDAVVAIDSDGMVTQWNPQAQTIFGYARDEAMGRSLSDIIIPTQYRDAHNAGMKRYLSTGEERVMNRRIEVTAIRRNGIEFPVELTVTPSKTGAVTQFFAFIRDISERKKGEEALQLAIRARDEFISIASHELKTPITSLKLQFQMAARQVNAGDTRVFTPEISAKRIASANHQLGRMSQLIDDMLDVTSVASGKLKMRNDQIDLSKLVQETLERFKEQFNLVGSTLEINISPDVRVVGDEHRTEQVLSNLLTNAIKYGAGKSVVVGLTSDAEKARITVQDHGIGIAKDDLERVFNRFERAVSADHISGLGLGLFITRQIVEASGGRISVQSQIGSGSTFTVELPRESTAS